MSFDVQKIRADFPILSQKVHGHPLVYLDSGASSQKPSVVIETIRDYYQSSNANVHRGAYTLSQIATEKYEGVRPKVARFLGLKPSESETPQEIIFTRGTTEALNLIAQCWGRKFVEANDDIVVTRMEHHSNFVCWQQLAQEKKANFKIIELDSNYRLDLDSLKEALSGRPKVLALTYQSNVLGTVNPIAEIAHMAKEAGAIVVVDAAQAVPSRPIRIESLGPIDFLAFSAHKMCGPTGVGVLWGRKELLETMSLYHYGGDMILQVKDQVTTWNELPWRFEAGTPHIEGVIALGAAIDYLSSIGMDAIEEHERKLTEKALALLKEIPGLQIFGPPTAEDRGPAISFVLEGVHPHDLATFLDQSGIAVRAGHHCAQPLLAPLGISATTRASFYFYNTLEEVDLLVKALKDAKEYFSV